MFESPENVERWKKRSVLSQTGERPPTEHDRRRFSNPAFLREAPVALATGMTFDLNDFLQVNGQAPAIFSPVPKVFYHPSNASGRSGPLRAALGVSRHRRQNNARVLRKASVTK